MAKHINSNHGYKTQTFSFRAPGARKVLLVGDFTHWTEAPILMEKDTQGTWRTTVPLELGTHLYRFIADGQWEDDPTSNQHLPNPYGTQDAVRQVS